MKTKLLLIWQKFLQNRDWLILALLGIGVFYVVQKSQAVQQINPESVWQQKYGTSGASRSPMAGIGGGGAGPRRPQGQAVGFEDAATLFEPIKLEDIEAISHNPVFTPAEQYNRLHGRLERLRDEFTNANQQGDTRTAIDRLQQYCREDPRGRILKWTTEPQEILRNLICEDVARNLDDAYKEAITQRESALGFRNSDPNRTIEMLTQLVTTINEALARVNEAENCSGDPRLSESRLEEIRSFVKGLEETRNEINRQMLQDEYDAVIQQAQLVDAQPDPETLAKAVQSLQNFRRLLRAKDPDGALLDQTQADQLNQIEQKIESNKESRSEEVRNQIANLTASGDYENNREILNQILYQYDILRLLGDTKSQSDRRRYESALQKIEANEAIARMQELTSELDAEIARLEILVQNNGSTQTGQIKVQNIMDELDSLKKLPFIRAVPGYREVSNEYTRLTRIYRQLKARMR